MSLISDNKLLFLLTRCGFSSKESLLISALARLGPRSPGLLSSQTGLKRPTVYLTLEGLHSRGLVVKSRGNGRLVYSLHHTKQLIAQLEASARKSYDILRSASTSLARELNQIGNHGAIKLGGFSVTTLQSNELILYALEEALNRGNYRGIFNPQLAISGRAKTVVSRFLQNTAASKPFIREIIVGGPMAMWYRCQIKNPNHHLRELPSNSKISTDIVISNDTVFLAHYNTPLENAIKIVQPDLYETWCTLFESLWEKVSTE